MSKVRLFFLVLISVAFAKNVQAQASAADVLAEMATHAGVIFSGSVEAVTRHDAQGFVEIRFAVDTCVRGCAAGGAYTLHEWAGRWLGHSERYRVGQRLLMLLTAPGPAGLSAPVYGTDGAIPIMAGAAASASASAEAAPAPAPVVDLRLLATRVMLPEAGSVRNHLIFAGSYALDGSGAGAVWPALTNVLTLLRGSVYAPR